MISPQEALFRLRDGNRRYVTTIKSPDSHLTLPGRIELAETQAPFAVVMGCSDSRVPIELIFDQSVGDLFVIRVAGNVATPTQIGSIEYGVEQLGARLVVVLGHTRCGAVEATMNELLAPGFVTSPHLKEIVDQVRPAFDPLTPNDSPPDRYEAFRKAVRENVRLAVRRIKEASHVVQTLMREADLRVVGAEYAVETGVVEFFEGVRTRSR